MSRLIKLYPRAWRDRYGAEFAALLTDLGGPTRSPGLAWDIARGAVDARLRGRFAMRPDPAVRRGLYDGLLLSGLIAVLVFLTNVAFPSGPQESDSDPEYLIQYLLFLVVMAALFILIGARGGRRVRALGGNPVLGGARAGATAGAVIATMVTLTFLAVNNLFLDTVSRQHDKRVAFAASGWTSMRAFLTVSQLRGAMFLIPVLALVGAGLGVLGATIHRQRATQPL